ncbi:MAG: hypothetical protein FWD27_00400 [Coriobacteriia bacterium]|nr:hypothetical protein [Coriobacteriia bacterium]
MVSSPELCFFQMSRVLSLPNLLELGLELCGSYAVSVPNINYGSPETMLKRLFNRPCLSSVERLASFLSQTEGTFAQRRFSSVLRYLANNSASPMESKLFLLLTLPYKHGGYGLLKPKFNATVKPASTARRVSGKNTYRCDLYWPDYDLAVEYDSKQHHLAPREQTQDATKRNSLATLGVLLITVTSAHIYSPMETERVAMQLAQGMEKRLQYRNPGFAKAHHELRTALDLERFY